MRGRFQRSQWRPALCCAARTPGSDVDPRRLTPEPCAFPPRLRSRVDTVLNAEQKAGLTGLREVEPDSDVTLMMIYEVLSTLLPVPTSRYLIKLDPQEIGLPARKGMTVGALI